MNERACLDRRRLEEAHLKYCILKMYKKYPNYFHDFKITSDVKHILEVVTPVYYKAFSELYMCEFIAILYSYIINNTDKVQ